MKNLMVLAVVAIGAVLVGCVNPPKEGYTYSPITMSDGYTATIRKKTEENYSGDLESIEEIKMPDGTWINCGPGCRAVYLSQKSRHPAKEVDRGGGGGSGGD